MLPEVVEDSQPDPEPPPPSRAKVKAKPKASSCVTPSWEVRLSRAQSLGVIAKHKLNDTLEEQIPVDPLPLKIRFWVVIRGSHCAHVGYTDRFAVAKHHTAVSDSCDQSVSSIPIVEAFSSLAEVREFWNQVFPEVPLEHLQSVCNSVEYLSTQ